MIFLTRALALFIITFLISCGSNGDLTHEQSCNQQFNALHEKFNKEKYSSIREKLNDLISTCTGSGFIEHAQYLLAESHFNLKEWLEAQHEYAILLEDFPSSKYGENSHFRMAISKKHQIHSVGRDQSPTEDAITEFDSFLKEFPNSTLQDSAKKYRSELQLVLAEKDIYTGDLYTKMDEPQAAVIYYQGVKEKYSDVIDALNLNVKMIESYIELGQLKQAESLLEELKKPDVNKKYTGQIKKFETALAKKRASTLKIREKKKQKPAEEL